MTDSISRTMSAVMAQRLEALGKSQADLAEAVGVSPGTVSHWITGRRLPRPQKFSEICAYLKLDEAELLGGKLPASKVGGVLAEIDQYAEALNEDGRKRLLLYAQELNKILEYKK